MRGEKRERILRILLTDNFQLSKNEISKSKITKEDIQKVSFQLSHDFHGVKRVLDLIK